jgi:hypothetical protein
MQLYKELSKIDDKKTEPNKMNERFEEVFQEMRHRI